eukprot:SM000258S09112  [mRNA]  locus=s258:45251:47373:- [translate_table: standard]
MSGQWPARSHFFFFFFFFFLLSPAASCAGSTGGGAPPRSGPLGGAWRRPPAEEGTVYNRSVALALVEHASVAYIDDEAALLGWNCSRCTGYVTEGFQMLDVIIDIPKRLTAYVGISAYLGSIVVAFRGTHESSLVNWIADLYFLQLDLNYPGVDNALVHAGFYAAYHNSTVRDRVLNAIARIRQHHPRLPVAITGHSLGAALACLCALDLRVNMNVQDLQLMTFGCPRVGNAAFAAFFNDMVPHSVRMTHEHDMVPHLPPMSSPPYIYSYYHIATEVWSYSIGIIRQIEVERVCDGSGEDPTCSRSVLGDSIYDHMIYLGVPLRGNKPHRHRRYTLPRGCSAETFDLCQSHVHRIR